MDMTNHYKSQSFKWNLAGAAAEKQHVRLQISLSLLDYLYQLVGVVVWCGLVGGECYL